MIGGRGEIPSLKMFFLGTASPFLVIGIIGIIIWFFNNKKWRDY